MQASPVPLLRLDHVSVTLSGKAILADINLAVEAGDKIAIRGRSGSGKSTLLKTLMGLHPWQGSIFFRETPLSSAAVAAIRSQIAYIGQEPVLGAETVREALLLPFGFAAHRGRAPDEERLAESLRAMDLPRSILDRPSSAVSGGEKQRIALARALLLDKTLYLLDEVTSALDQDSRRAVFGLLETAGITAVSISHDPEWIARCTAVHTLAEGRLIREDVHGHP